MRLAVIIALLVLTGCAGESGESTGYQRPDVDSPNDIVTYMDTSRLTSLSATGGNIIAEGEASTDPGDSTRTDWFEILGAIEYSARFDGSFEVREILSGTTLIDQKDEVGVGIRSTMRKLREQAREIDPESALFRVLEENGAELETLLALRRDRLRRFDESVYSEQDLVDYAEQHAGAAGVVVEEVNYVPFFGGAAEFVLRPSDEAEFLTEADPRLSRFLGGLPNRPSLVTIVDSYGANRIVLGSVPYKPDYSVTLGGPCCSPVIVGIGLLWQADGIHISGRSIGHQPNTCLSCVTTVLR